MRQDQVSQYLRAPLTESAAGGWNGSSTDGRYPRRDSRNEFNLGFREALPYPELESGLETVEA